MMSESPFRIDIEERSAGGLRVPVYILHDTQGSVRAEVWPANGFNLLRWQTGSANGWQDWLFASPEWEANPVPSRSGFPILFPFPNRIRDGRFVFKGREYQLPKNDSTSKNGIHGMAPRRPWEIVSTSVADDHAVITGRFSLSPMLMGPEWNWPGQGTLTIRYELTRTTLHMSIVVENTGHDDLPFGLGFHPYFRHPDAVDGSINNVTLIAPIQTLWETHDGLPTGRKVPAPSELQFGADAPIGTRTADTLYADVRPTNDRETFFGELSVPNASRKLTMTTSTNFRDLVLFTPVHRQAVCIEPYTCATDAVHLEEQGVDAGWLVLPAGRTWEGWVRLHINQ